MADHPLLTSTISMRMSSRLDVLGHDDPTMIRKLQDLSGIDPNDIPMDDPGSWPSFWDRSARGDNRADRNADRGCWGFQSLGPTLFGAWSKKPIRRLSRSYFSSLVCLTVPTCGWGNAQDLIKAGIADLSTVIGCRDDIMVYLMHAGLKPKMAFTIMERVRKGVMAQDL